MARDEEFVTLMANAEALLFVSDEPVSSAKLAAAAQVSPVQMEEALALLAAEYADEDRGIQLREVAGGWRFYTHPAYHDSIEAYVLSWDTRRLSQAALEALAVIAYHQPVTRAGVNAIRGVNSEGVISSLVEKGLVREVGRDDAPGNAILYGTTRSFLEHFGLKSINDLPPLEDFAPNEESGQLIKERLSGVDERRSQLNFEDGIEENLHVNIERSDGTMLVEEVDRRDDLRVDDPAGVSAVLDEALTEKVDFAHADFSQGDVADDDEDEEIPTIE